MTIDPRRLSARYVPTFRRDVTRRAKMEHHDETDVKKRTVYSTMSYGYYWPKYTAPTTDWSMGMRVALCAVYTGLNRLWTDCRHLVIRKRTRPVTRIQDSCCARGAQSWAWLTRPVDYRVNFEIWFLKWRWMLNARTSDSFIDMTENRNI